MTIRDFNAYVKAYNERIEHENKREDYKAWLNGFYVAYAIGHCFGGGKYPENPLTAIDKEEEQKKQVELLFASLSAMKTNFELNKEG